jgi:hypothetical protein
LGYGLSPYSPRTAIDAERAAFDVLVGGLARSGRHAFETAPGCRISARLESQGREKRSR